jgi:hypothetical protein
MILGLMLAAGMWWMMQPVATAVPQAEPPMEALYGPWVITGGLVLAALAGIVLLRRYLLVKKILGHGANIKGTVEVADRFDTNMHSNTDTIQTTPTYAYYVTIRYAVHGVERKVRLKLPHSPGTYGIKQGGEVDLLALDWMPHKPLIRAVYLGGVGPRPRRLFW